MDSHCFVRVVGLAWYDAHLPHPHAIFSGIADRRNCAHSDLPPLVFESEEECDGDVESDSDDEDANDAGTMVSLYSVFVQCLFSVYAVSVRCLFSVHSVSIQHRF
jgi:hypothetical protein